VNLSHVNGFVGMRVLRETEEDILNAKNLIVQPVFIEYALNVSRNVH
jgi:hypothetical protein